MTDKTITAADIADVLLEPFDPFDIEWRVQQAGKQGSGTKWALVLAYVTNRAIMERLDQVFGIDGWQNDFQEVAGGFVCGLKCKVGGDWIVKYDGADRTTIEATKGGLSNAMKRAGVQWGIGRYLYRLEPTFVTLLGGKAPDGDFIPAFVKDLGGRHHFKRPSLPDWALPGGRHD